MVIGMKKLILLCFCLIFVGCTSSNQDKVKTLIEEDKNVLIGINYPITNIPNLDRIIEKEVKNIYNHFNEEYGNFNSLKEKSELNIDYHYNIIKNRYHNISLNVFIDSSFLAHPNNYVKTYVYDQKEDKLLTLGDIVPKDQMKTIASIVTSYLFEHYSDCILMDELKQKINDDPNSYSNFILTKDKLLLYFERAEITASYCGIIEVPIDYHKIGLNHLIDDNQQVMIDTIKQEKRNLDPNGKYIALTFDDGPSIYTKNLIEYLHSRNAKATFFILGNKVIPYKDTLMLSLSYGNELGNHSYNHKWLRKLGINDFVNQIDKTQTIMKETLGYTPVLMRPTYGDVTDEMRKHTSLDIALWNIDTMDWKYKSVNKIVSRALSNVKDGNIILMHDIHKRTIDAVKKIVPKLEEMGYQLVTVSELREIQMLRYLNEL